MIKLNFIQQESLNKHLNFFFESSGYRNLINYSRDQNIDASERNFYNYLIENDNAILKNILIGHPKNWDLKEWITLYHGINNTSDTTLIRQIKLTLNNKENFENVSDDEISEIISNLKLYISIHSDSEEALAVYNNKANKTTKENLRKKLKDDAKRIKVSDFESRLFKIFNYKSFSKSKVGWGAYALVEAIEISVCPYCNRNFINFLNTKDASTRPALDHFYPQSIYPFLALSIGNLIPSCHVCNSDLKNDFDFFSEPHIHPYIDSFHKYAEFVIIPSKIKEVKELTMFNRKINYEIKVRDNISEEMRSKTNKTIQTFKINELYAFHSDCVEEISLKSFLYNKDRLDDLNRIKIDHIQNINEDSNKLFQTKDFARLILGNYININEFSKRPLSKLTYDIASETGLLDKLGIKYKK